MFLIIDNYDSFTYNLSQAFAEIGVGVKVVKKDALTFEEIEAMDLKGIVISPGPGRPESSGVCLEVIQKSKVPILGVCLGHQAIGICFGTEVNRAPEIFHGKEDLVFHTRKGLFQGMPLPFKAGRYHSLVVEKVSADLVIDAESATGVVMAMHHQTKPIYGVQFHPESILTPEGKTILKNFVEICHAQ